MNAQRWILGCCLYALATLIILIILTTKPKSGNLFGTFSQKFAINVVHQILLAFPPCTLGHGGNAVLLSCIIKLISHIFNDKM